MFQLTRILMSAIDAGGGLGGSPLAPAPAQPTEPPAQPAAAQLDDATRKAIVAEARDSFFAEARRSGLLPSNDKSTRTRSRETTTETTSIPAIDPVAAISLVGALARAGHTPASDRAFKRIARAFGEDAPTDVDVWVREYFDDIGVAQKPAPTNAPAQPVAPQAPATQPTRNDLPVTQRPPPPAAQIPLEDQRILDMSPADRDELVRRKGNEWFSNKVRSEMMATPTRVVLRR